MRRPAPGAWPPGEPAAAAPCPRLPSVAIGDWEVLERVALRGMRVGEVAEAVGIDRREALLRLHRGLAAFRTGSAGEREPGDDPDAAARSGLGGDLAAGRFDDLARDRQPEPAAVA